MIRRADERKKLELKNAQGGLETIFPNVILEGEEFTDAGRLFNIVTFPPKSSIGYHVHNGESETYVVLSGEGKYSDNGTEVMVGVGDVTFCPSGEGHGLENIGDEDLVVIALILFDKTK
jgi:Mannose-6-phosphate isomerase